VIEDLFTPMHLLVLFVIIFFLFGAKRLPDLGKSLGHGIREFRSGIAGLSETDQELPAATTGELPPAAPGEPNAAPAADAAAPDAVTDAMPAESSVAAPAEPSADDPAVIEGTAVEIDDEAETTSDGGEAVTAGVESQQERAAS